MDNGVKSSVPSPSTGGDLTQGFLGGHEALISMPSPSIGVGLTQGVLGGHGDDVDGSLEDFVQWVQDGGDFSDSL